MARSTKQSADAPPTPTTGSPTRTLGSLTRNGAPAPVAPGRASGAHVPRQTGGPVGLGSPIYEELVAELGDPTS